MATDLFNNPSNDYINPGLAPCAGSSDTYSFEFFPKKEVGIISGSDIIQSMNLSDIKIPVTGWVEQKKTIQSGEVIFVPGLEKGLLTRTQVFKIPVGGYSAPTSAEGAPKYFMSLDISVAYYYNFRYYHINIEASSNYSQNIDIDDAMNIALSDLNINTTCTYDPSYFKFEGGTAGYDYNITNVELLLIDKSESTYSPFDTLYIDGEKIDMIYDLEEDITRELPSAKYPNGAMLGYVMKTSFPSTAGINDKWLYYNIVNSPFTIYESTTAKAINNVSLYSTLDYDPSLSWPPLVEYDVSTQVYADISIGDVSIGSMDSSIWDPSIYNMTIDSSSIVNTWILDSSIIDSSISNSFVKNVDVSSAIPVTLQDSSVLNSDIKGNITVTRNKIQDTNIVDSSTYYGNTISYSSLKRVDIDVSGGTISNSILKGNGLSIIVGNENGRIIVSDSSIQSYNITSANFTGSVILDSSIWLTDVSASSIGDSSIYHGQIYDSSIVNSYILDSSLNNVFVDSSDGTYISRTSAVSSSFNNVVLNNDTSVYDSSIHNSWTNYFYPWDEWIADLESSRVYIRESEIMDTSLNNTWVYDSSIWISTTDDCSLIRCTIYNSDMNETNTLTDCRIVTVNASFDSSILYETTTNSYYEKLSKKIEVGMSGSGTSTILSAADYLDYVNSDNLWDKIGPFAAQISAPDPGDTTTKNLIGGFYVYNPHTFPVKIEYMLINNS